MYQVIFFIACRCSVAAGVAATWLNVNLPLPTPPHPHRVPNVTPGWISQDPVPTQPISPKAAVTKVALLPVVLDVHFILQR